MILFYATLTDRAMCDAALAEVNFELKTFATRDANLELADDRADRSQTSTAAQLAKVNAKIATQDILLATPGLDAETLETAGDERAALLVQQKRLTKRGQQSSGVSRFLADVDAQQIADQVATLTAVRDGITAHRATLPA